MSAAPRKIDCRDAAARLYDYLDREITPELKAEVEGHLKECAGCFRQFEFERVFLTFLEARGRARGAPEAVKRRIIEELFEAEEP